MKFIGLVLGIFAFFLVGAFVGELATHNAQAGGLPGLVAAIWVAWPFFHKAEIQRLNFLHPPAKVYNGTSPEVFEHLHDELRQAVYRLGDRWHIIVADTQANKLVADLQYFDEEFRIQPAGNSISTKTERVRRLIRLQAQFKDTDGQKTEVQFDFEPRAEGTSGEEVCDELINTVMENFESRVGKGTPVSAGISCKLPGPPWWLIALTGYMVFCFAGDVIKNIFGAGQ